MEIKGIDISHYQGNIDITKVQASTSFVICKATEGYGYTDPNFNTYRNQLRNSGMPRGYYHYARPDLGNTATSEADWFLKTVGTLQQGELLCLDAEQAGFKGDWVVWCKAFLDEIKAKIGYKPLLYINLNFNNLYNWSPVVKGDYGLWLALWDNKPDVRPNTDWPFIAIKQYGAITINGIKGNVDGNIFYGDVNTFKKYGFQVPVIPTPVPTPIPTPIPEPIPEPVTPPVDVPIEPIPPVNPPVDSTPSEPITEPTVKKTLLEIIIQFFTDLLQRILKSD